MTDTGGARRSLSDYRGKLVLLYFGYMFCSDVCPTDLFEKVLARSGPHYFVDRSANLYLIDREGRYLGYFPPGTNPERLLDVLRDYL